MACPTTPTGGEGQTLERKSRQIGPSPNMEEEETFHGKLVGALKEHQGMPMVCNWHARAATSFNDGCGLCSPGRWAPSRRNFQKGAVKGFIDKLASLI